MTAARQETLVELSKKFLESNPSIPQDDKSNIEFEVKFGTMGVKPVVRLDFDNVVNRLFNNGFTTSNPNGETFMRIQSEYFEPTSGRTKISNVRCVISSIESIQKYCKTNTLDNIPDNTLLFEQKTDIKKDEKNYYQPANNKDFNFRATIKREKIISKSSPMIRELIMQWSNNKKIFRLINRTTFTHSIYPLKVELSIVKSSNSPKGKNIPEYTIQSSGVLTSSENYEIEIEVINMKTGSGTPWTYENYEEFILMIKNNIKIILSGLQQTSYPVSYPEQYSVIQDYFKLVNGSGYVERSITPRDFIGPSSMTLQISNIAPINDDSSIPNVRSNYTVTDKADGARKLLYIHNNSKVYLIDTNMNVQFTGAVTKNEELLNSILDGEHILHNKKGDLINLYAAFDVYIINEVGGMRL